jgi:adenylate cyclase
MKYRARLLVTFLLTVILINGVTLGVMYYVASRSLFEEVGNNALSVAATTAAFVDGEEHKSIQNPGDEKTDAYRRIKEILKKARDANRRDDTYVKNLYTMKHMVAMPTVLAYGVDSEESPDNVAAVDRAIKILSGRTPAINQEGVDRDDYSQDEDGWWLSANVPVKDRSGNVVAAIGVDFQKSFVQKKLDRLAFVGLLCFGLATVLGSVFAIIYSGHVSRPVRSLYRTIEAVGQGDFNAQVEVRRADEFGHIARGVNSMTEGLRQNEAVKSAFTCYVSSEVLKKILETGMQPTIQTNRRKITVLFSDIREFTRMSENMRPEEVVGILNEYFEKMVDVVVRHKGMVDKFIGDGLMAFFGAPDDDGFQEEHAVNAALEMQEELRKLCKKWSSEGRRSLQIGIGINSGNAIVGNIGSAQRLEYTAIGDTVNLAARLESATKDFDADVLISEYTFNGLKGSPFKITKKGAASLKGRTDTVTVYAVAPISHTKTEIQSEATS